MQLYCVTLFLEHTVYVKIVSKYALLDLLNYCKFQICIFFNKRVIGLCQVSGSLCICKGRLEW